MKNFFISCAIAFCALAVAARGGVEQAMPTPIEHESLDQFAGLDDRWSLVLEADYRHISNAEIKKPNFVIDSVGGNVGFGFSFNYQFL